VNSKEFIIESPRGKYINRDFTINEAGRWEITDLET
jgi:hypothetical protein